MDATSVHYNNPANILTSPLKTNIRGLERLRKTRSELELHLNPLISAATAIG